VDGDVGETSSLESTWSQTSRWHSSLEHDRRLVQEPLQPDRPAVAPQRVAAEPQVQQDVEQLTQTTVDTFQLVAVQPQIAQGEVELYQRLGVDVTQRAVVQVQTGRRQTRERRGKNLHVAIAVDEQVLEG